MITNRRILLNIWAEHFSDQFSQWSWNFPAMILEPSQLTPDCLSFELRGTPHEGCTEYPDDRRYKVISNEQGNANNDYTQNDHIRPPTVIEITLTINHPDKSQSNDKERENSEITVSRYDPGQIANRKYYPHCLSQYLTLGRTLMPV